MMWLQDVRAWLRMVWRKTLWNLRWPWIWARFRLQEWIMAIRSLRVSLKYQQEDEQHRITLKIRWERFAPF
jgi:hypothetical protein